VRKGVARLWPASTSLIAEIIFAETISKAG
jgi:hypothetical protein